MQIEIKLSRENAKFCFVSVRAYAINKGSRGLPEDS